MDGVKWSGKHTSVGEPFEIPPVQRSTLQLLVDFIGVSQLQSGILWHLATPFSFGGGTTKNGQNKLIPHGKLRISSPAGKRWTPKTLQKKSPPRIPLAISLSGVQFVHGPVPFVSACGCLKHHVAVANFN